MTFQYQFWQCQLSDIGIWNRDVPRHWGNAWSFSSAENSSHRLRSAQMNTTGLLEGVQRTAHSSTPVCCGDWLTLASAWNPQATADREERKAKARWDFSSCKSPRQQKADIFWGYQELLASGTRDLSNRVTVGDWHSRPWRNTPSSAL